MRSGIRYRFLKGATIAIVSSCVACEGSPHDVVGASHDAGVSDQYSPGNSSGSDAPYQPYVGDAGAGDKTGPGEPTDDSGADDAGPTSDGGCVHGPFPSPDIYDSHCNFDLNAYTHIATSLNSDDGLSYRFGPDSTYYHSTPLSLPTLPRATINICGTGAIPGPPPAVILYQIAGTCDITNPGNYSSDQGLVLYESDVAPDGGVGPGGGVDNIQIESFAYNSFFYLPSPSPDFADIPYAMQLASSSWTTLAGGPVHSPVAVGRGIAPYFGQTSQVGFVAFNDGLIGTIGANSEGGGLAIALPSGMVPTSLSLTNGNEFLLVTVWDTTTTTGKLAVFSVESDHTGLNDLDYNYYDFHQHLPGFINTGDATTLKLLGMIDLPGIIAPTDIAVGSNYQSAFFLNNGSYKLPANFDLTDQSQWQTFTGTGENSTQRSTAGFAVITSRSERKVAFVDLQPLFEAFNAEYFTSFATFQMTQSNWGPAPTQWPFTFDNQSQAKPVVVSTISIPQIPTAVYAGRFGDLDPSKSIHALIATMDGILHIYDVGGLVDVSAASASAIKEIGTVAVGKNPTGIAIRKAGMSSTQMPDPVSGSTGNVEGQQVFVVSRGDREIDFVTVTGATGNVYNKLQDAPLVDPVAIDDADQESFLSYVLTVADLKGRQVLSYRYGPITLPTDHTYHPLPTDSNGKTTFECGGAYSVSGQPFAVSGTNVP